MKKAKLFTTLGATALIGAIGIGSTFAYLSDKTATVTNTFTVGNVSFDDEFDSGLRESKVTRDAVGEDTSSNYKDNDGADTWESVKNEYTDLVAGETVYKDPTVIMSDTTQDAWVFAMITNTEDAAFANIAWNTEEWVDVTDAYKTANEITGNVDYVVYAKKTIIGKEGTSTIFTSVTMADGITEKTVIPTIKVSAFAIQAAGFDSYADAISEVTFE